MAENKELDPELGWVDAVPLRPPMTLRRWAIRPWCALIRFHAPKDRVNGDVWRCRCGKVAWRDARTMMSIPGAGLVFGFRKIEGR